MPGIKEISVGTKVSVNYGKDRYESKDFFANATIEMEPGDKLQEVLAATRRQLEERIAHDIVGFFKARGSVSMTLAKVKAKYGLPGLPAKPAGDFG